MRALLFVALALASCDDCAGQPTVVEPTCSSLGCDTALCTRAGECTCDGKACRQARPDGGL